MLPPEMSGKHKAAGSVLGEFSRTGPGGKAVWNILTREENVNDWILPVALSCFDVKLTRT